MDLIGYLSTLIMGLILGLLGGGGSILTVPIMVYAFGIPALLATSYSLFIVGSSSCVGVFIYAKQGLINYKLSSIFLLPSIAGLLFSRMFILTKLPSDISLFSFTLSQDRFILLFFSLLCFIIAFFMFRSPNKPSSDVSPEKKVPSTVIIAAEGLLVGMMTGFVGAGGGFMIVPALCFFCHLSIKEAIASSLFIISLKSLIGFLGDLSVGLLIDWFLLGKIVTLTLVGVLLGTLLNKYLNAIKLRKSFAFFISFMALFILIKEGIL